MTQKSAGFEWGPNQKKFSAASLSYIEQASVLSGLCGLLVPHDARGIVVGKRCCVREKDIVPQKETEYCFPQREKMLDMKEQTDVQLISIVVIFGVCKDF